MNGKYFYWQAQSRFHYASVWGLCPFTILREWGNADVYPCQWEDYSNGRLGAIDALPGVFWQFPLYFMFYITCIIRNCFALFSNLQFIPCIWLEPMNLFFKERPNNVDVFNGCCVWAFSFNSWVFRSSHQFIHPSIHSISHLSRLGQIVTNFSSV